MNGENSRLDGHPNANAIRALEAIMIAMSVNPDVRIVLVNDDGEPLSDDERRELNISLGRDPEMGIGSDAPGK